MKIKGFLARFSVILAIFLSQSLADSNSEVDSNNELDSSKKIKKKILPPPLFANLANRAGGFSGFKGYA